MPAPRRFTPIVVGDIALGHCIVMAPLACCRNDENHVPVQSRAAVYYSQRACIPGALLISEATFIAQRAGGYTLAPGVWSPAQLAAWKQAALLRLRWRKGLERVGASDIPLTGLNGPAPRPLTASEIREYTTLYAAAAANAVAKAGFDGVEVHSGNGYLQNQFLENVSNDRTDEYGGSIENRARSLLDAVAAVTEAVGQKKTGVRLSP